MQVVEKIAETRDLIKQARAEGKTIGFVPTMGALHQGHISLIQASVKKCDFTVVSIFVNPTQFGPNEDYNKYPRTLEKDLQICEENGVDVVFTPSAAQMYPAENRTWVTVEKLTERLCGKSRPGHFRGVTTVCTKLFNIVAADIAFFGQKDAQQAIVIQKMAADLNIDLKIEICPTVRESNGLAMSSRNKYLTDDQKNEAAAIYKSLQKGENLMRSGVRDSQTIIGQMRNILCEYPSIEVEYICLVDPETLENVEIAADYVLIAIAAKIGQTRLIDNIIVDLRSE